MCIRDRYMGEQRGVAKTLIYQKRKCNPAMLNTNDIEVILHNNPLLKGKKIGIVFMDLPRNNLHPFLRESFTFQAGKYNLIQINANYSVSSKSELEELSLIHISEPTRPLYISYAVFCLKKKKTSKTKITLQPQPNDEQDPTKRLKQVKQS
eukprot:TRINITY_DN10256_c0_g1_i1.p1 TRINITY_DN10256_c0_g1~~TRINITY_DN10256_c0_g1_i1.p1  ORF type:complete len:151 (+),score=16.53 TRINITY_DN10256_c0_g1_i1:178-630(+)